MPAEKATALVLRVVDFSESSCVVTLFTREFGKIGALAKGGRRPKGPFEAALDLLAICRIVFLQKSSDALDLLTEAKLERRFRPPGKSLAALYGGYYVAELVNELTDMHDPHPELFDLCEATLTRLAEGWSVAEVVLRFELELLRIVGHLPALERCAECGTEVESGRTVAFGLTDGGVLCARCRRGRQRVILLSSVGRELMKWVSLGNADKAPAGTPARAYREVRSMMNRYLAHLIGHPLKMHRIMEN